MDTTAQLQERLSGYIGTENYYRHPLARPIKYTDGVRAFADHAEAYWLVDILATQPEIVDQMRKGGFAMATLTVGEDNEADLVATDGDEHTVYKRHLNYTDCPPGEWKFYLVGEVILLPSEY